MITRYTEPEMAHLWSDSNKLDNWLKVEVSACQAMESLGTIPLGTTEKIKSSINNGSVNFNNPVVLRELALIESETKHDFFAFLVFLESVMPEGCGQWIHYGLTSSDVVDTALSMTIKQSANLIIEAVSDLLVALEQKIKLHKSTIMVGRSHGMHAEPTTFGLVLASHYEEIKRGMYRVMDAKEAISVGAISGPVGNYTNIDPRVEVMVCDDLGLNPDKISTQVICRDRHAQYFTALSILATSIERMAVQFRHLQRSEVDEVEEGFDTKKQRGSSAMPHKKNPITSENLTGLARLVRSYAQSAIENMVLWHERDISHSSVERVIGPDANAVVHHMAKKAKQLVEQLVVKSENMSKNLERSKTSIASHRMLLELVNSGMKRSEAHSLVRRCIQEDNFEPVCEFLKVGLDDLRDLRWFVRHSESMINRLFEGHRH